MNMVLFYLWPSNDHYRLLFYICHCERWLPEEAFAPQPNSEITPPELDSVRFILCLKKKYLLCLWFTCDKKKPCVFFCFFFLSHQPQCWSCQYYRWRWAADVIPLILLNVFVFMECFFFFSCTRRWAFGVEEVVTVLWGWINELSTLSDDRKMYCTFCVFCQSVGPTFSHDFRFESCLQRVDSS